MAAPRRVLNASPCLANFSTRFANLWFPPQRPQSQPCPVLSSLTTSKTNNSLRAVYSNKPHRTIPHSAAAMATPGSDAGGFMMSDAISRAGTATPRHNNYGYPSSSAGRPRGPPSEVTGAPSDDEGDGFADDQVPRSSRLPDASDIPRVEDRIGLLVQEHFESFIQK